MPGATISPNVVAERCQTHEELPPMKDCRTLDLGRIAYGEAAALQQRLVAARKIGAAPDLLLFCEHPHVITLGRNGKREHLRVSEDLLRQDGVEFHPTNRGGDITYHGPGQIVGYPVLDLNGTDSPTTFPPICAFSI